MHKFYSWCKLRDALVILKTISKKDETTPSNIVREVNNW